MDIKIFNKYTMCLCPLLSSKSIWLLTKYGQSPNNNKALTYFYWFLLKNCQYRITLFNFDLADGTCPTIRCSEQSRER